MKRKAITTMLALSIVCMLVFSFVPVISLVRAVEEDDSASSGPPSEEFETITEYESTFSGSPYNTMQYVNSPRPPFGEHRWYFQDFEWQHTFDPTGKQVLSVTLEIRAWDVDWGVEWWREHDLVYADGDYFGELNGTDSDWSVTAFIIDPALLADGQLDIWLDIDSTHYPMSWGVTIDWSRLTVVWESSRSVEKTLSAAEGELGDVIHVTITVNVPPGETATIVDTLPGGFEFFVKTFMVDGLSTRIKNRKNPTIGGHDIVYDLTESGTHVIEFDVKVDEAKSWEDITLCNLVTATWFDGEGEEIETKEDSECFIIHAFEELHKSVGIPKKVLILPIPIGELSDFDVHNIYHEPVDNLELELYGIQSSDIVGWFPGWGTPPQINPISGGTEVIWMDSTQPVMPCEWEHFGLYLKPGVVATEIEAYWTQLEAGLTIKEKTDVQWRLEIEVTNPFSYTMTDTVITDSFGAEIEIDEPFPYSITQGTMSFTTKTKGKYAKVFLTWDIGDLLPGETARLIFLVSTVLDPKGHQAYSEPGIYEMNSGATLKFIDPEDIQLSVVTDSIYLTVLPLEDC